MAYVTKLERKHTELQLAYVILNNEQISNTYFVLVLFSLNKRQVILLQGPMCMLCVVTEIVGGASSSATRGI